MSDYIYVEKLFHTQIYMLKFKPMPLECEICGRLAQIYTVYRREIDSFFYVCDFHNHMQLSELTIEKRHYMVEKHLYRHDDTLKYFDFEYTDMIKYNKTYHSIKDVNEEKYNIVDMKYNKNIYVLKNGRMLRDYFENGRWELADKSISDVYIWIKA